MHMISFPCFAAILCRNSIAAHSGTLRSPATIRPSFKTSVSIVKVAVTAAKTAGTNHAFVVQDPTSTSWAGIYVYIGAAAPPAVGAEVSVSGTFEVFNGLEQINATGTGTF